ncbi:MAG: hypothetical protein M3O15_11660, partial [Acidobacteriota bacterium]|nr:hypothetical protein [Acidobacteriota bacterium]
RGSTGLTGRLQAAAALASQPLRARDDEQVHSSISRAEIEELLRGFDIQRPEERVAALVCTWYLHILPDEKIAARLKGIPKLRQLSFYQTLRELEERLGQRAGRRRMKSTRRT